MQIRAKPYHVYRNNFCYIFHRSCEIFIDHKYQCVRYRGEPTCPAYVYAEAPQHTPARGASTPDARMTREEAGSSLPHVYISSVDALSLLSYLTLCYIYCLLTDKPYILLYCHPTYITVIISFILVVKFSLIICVNV